MPITYLYRKNGGKVVGMSVEGVTSYAGIDVRVFGTVDDPAIPDGASLTPPKIFDDTATEAEIRNANARELTAFRTAETADDLAADRQSAKALIDTGANKKLLRSLVETLVDELNILRALHSLPNRQLAQVVGAIKSKIDNGSND